MYEATLPSENGVMKLCARIGTPLSFAAFTAVTAESVPIGLMLSAFTPFSSNCCTVVTNAWKSPSLAGACTSNFQPAFSPPPLRPVRHRHRDGAGQPRGQKPHILRRAARRPATIGHCGLVV